MGRQPGSQSQAYMYPSNDKTLLVGLDALAQWSWLTQYTVRNVMLRDPHQFMDTRQNTLTTPEMTDSQTFLLQIPRYRCSQLFVLDQLSSSATLHTSFSPDTAWSLSKSRAVWARSSIVLPSTTLALFG